MNVPPYVLVIVLILFGFLTGSTIFFYGQSRDAVTTRQANEKATFSGKIPDGSTETSQDKALAANTKPAEPKGRLSYPTNVYSVGSLETLFAIGQKFELPWQLIFKANGLTNENVIQAGYPLVIPALSHETDYYRVNLTLNETVAARLNQELRSASTSEYFDPVKVAKKDAVPYFGLTNDADYRLGEQDQSKGTAAVEVKKNGERIAIVGLYQPKVKGSKGLWAVLYIEDQSQ